MSLKPIDIYNHSLFPSQPPMASPANACPANQLPLQPVVPTPRSLSSSSRSSVSLTTWYAVFPPDSGEQYDLVSF